MRQNLFLSVVFSLLALSACASEDAPVVGAADSIAPTTVAGGDPLSGTWVGDWGPSQGQRNPVTVALNWDGTTLSGTVNPGPDAVTVTKASFAPDTGIVMMEASANASGGKLIHYAVEGKLAEGAITGTWIDGDKKGDFKITKS